MRRHVLVALASMAAGLSFPLVARAQAFPSKPLRIIVPATPGGSSDVLAARLP